MYSVAGKHSMSHGRQSGKERSCVTLSLEDLSLIFVSETTGRDAQRSLGSRYVSLRLRLQQKGGIDARSKILAMVSLLVLVALQSQKAHCTCVLTVCSMD